MAGSSWPTLNAGAKAKASDVEAKFDWIEGSIVPMNGGNQTNNALDLGTSSNKWRTGYFGTSVIISTTNITGTTTGLTVNAGLTAGGYRFNVIDDNNAGFAAVMWNTPGSGLPEGLLVGVAQNSTNRILAAAVGAFGTSATVFEVRGNGQTKLATGTAINEFSTDGTLADNSDLAVPTEKAVKTYVDSPKSAVRIYMDSATSATITMTTTTQLIPFNIVSFDVNSEYSTSAYKFTATLAGRYLVQGAINVQLANTTAVLGQIFMRINGSNKSFVRFCPFGSVGGTGDMMVLFHDFFSLGAGDTIDIAGNANTTTGIILRDDATTSGECGWLNIFRATA